MGGRTSPQGGATSTCSPGQGQQAVAFPCVQASELAARVLQGQTDIIIDVSVVHPLSPPPSFVPPPPPYSFFGRPELLWRVVNFINIMGKRDEDSGERTS